MLWKDKYKIGIDKIDRQHEELFNRVEAFVALLRSSLPWAEKFEQVSQTLAYMQAYVVFHFQDEGHFLHAAGYPHKEAHCKIHTQFTQEVAEFADRWQTSGHNEALAQQFAGRLMVWLIHHVAMEDQKFGAFIRKNGGSP